MVGRTSASELIRFKAALRPLLLLTMAYLRLDIVNLEYWPFSVRREPFVLH